MGFFNPITYFIKSFIRLFTRKFFWVLLIVILIFLGFVVFSNMSNAYTPDDFGVQGILEQKIIENTPFTASQFSSNRYYSYVICQNPIDFHYWCFACYCDLAPSGTNDVFFSSNPTSFTNMNFHIYSKSEFNGYLLEFDGDLSLLNVYNNRTSSRGTFDLNSFCSSYFNVDVSGVFKYCNLLFVNSNKLSTLRKYYTNFNLRSGIDYPYTENLNENLSSADYFVIDPMDLVIVYQNTTYVQDFSLKIYSGYASTPDDIVEENLINSFTLNNNSTYFDSSNLLFNIPVSIIKQAISNNGSGDYFTISFVSQNNHVEILNEFYYDHVNDTLVPVDSSSTDLSETNNKIDEVNNSINNLNGSVENMSNSITNMTNSITDSNIDNSSIDDFSSLGNDFETEDVSGIDELFQKLYDAFCTDEIQDVSLTIPFVNKTFAINTNNVSNNFPEPIKNIVALFVWGVIGLYVLKDIRTIIDKISEGSPESVGSDVKKEVL